MIKRYKNNKNRRTVRTRAKVASPKLNFRLTVKRSNKYIYVQLIDLAAGKTLSGVMTKDPAEAGKKIAAAAKKMKVDRVTFDRGPYKYHGKIKMLAESARAAGLMF